MLKSATFFSSTSTSQQKQPSWSIYRLPDGLAYSEYIPSPENNGESLYRMTDFLYLLKNPHPRSPIDDILFGIHRGGIVSFILNLHIGTYEQVHKMIRSFIPIELGPVFHRPLNLNCRSPRPAITLSADYLKPVDRDRTKRFIAFIEHLAPFDQKLRYHVIELLERAQQVAELCARGLEELVYSPHSQHKEIPPRHWKPRLDLAIDKKIAKSVPFLLHSNTVSLSWGGTQYYDERCDNHFIPDIPPLHLAILENDLAGAVAIIQQEPFTLFQKDPWRCRALDLAVECGTEEMCVTILPFLEKLPAPKQYQKEDIIRLKMRIPGYLTLPGIPEKCEPLRHPLSSLTPLKRDTLVSHYLQRYEQQVGHNQLPQRHPIHVATIEGNLDKIENLVAQNRDLLVLKDPWGYTPLIIATANDHVHIVKWLIKQGVSLETYAFELNPGMCYFNPFQNAKSIQMMRLFLFHQCYDIKAVSSHLQDFVEDGNVEGVETLLYFGYEIKPRANGLTSLAWLLAHPHHPNAAKMLSLFLSFKQDYVHEGPYDENLSKEFTNFLIQHNLAITRQKINRRYRPEIQSVLFDKETHAIKTFMVCLRKMDDSTTKTIKITSSIQPNAYITFAERWQIGELWMANFSLIPISISQFFSVLTSAIPKMIEFVLPSPDPQRKSFIDIGKSGSRVIYFFYFELIKSFHDSVGDFILFYGQAAAVHRLYSTLRLVNLTFRVPHTVKKLYPEMRVFAYFKGLRPGWSASFLPTSNSAPFYFPKVKYNMDLMKHIVELTGDTLLEDNTVRAHMSVNNQEMPPQRYDMREHWHLAGKDPANAVPYCYEITAQETENFCNTTNVPDEHLEDMKEAVSELMEYQPRIPPSL